MSEFFALDLAFGGIALAAAVLYAAWHEYAAKNQRDAKLLFAAGAASLIGGVTASVL